MANIITGKGQLAMRSALANGGMVNAITQEMRKKMRGLLVVSSKNGDTVVLNGGLSIGIADGTKMPTVEFSQKLPAGVRCVHNPKFNQDGSLNMSTR